MITIKRHVSSLLALAGLVLLFLVSFTANAFAAGAALPTDSTPLLDLLRPVYDAFAGGHNVAAGALALVAMIALLKRYAESIPTYGTSINKFLHTDAGGAMTTLGLSFFGAIGTATLSGSLSWAIISTAGGIAVVAVGGYTLLKKLVLDRLQDSAWFKTSAPALLKMVVSLIDPPSPIVVAEKAGADAVAAAPSKGSTDLVPPATKF